MGFAAGGHVDDLTCSRVSGSRLWTRFFDLEYAETTDLDPPRFHQTFPHRFEDHVNHIGREVLLASCILADPQGEFFLGGCAQANTSQSYPIRVHATLILMRTQ